MPSPSQSSIPRRALITGASSGIGAATARLLARSGYQVALLARRRERLEALVNELGPGQHLVLPCDLTDPEALQQAIERAGSTWGAIDLLVHNAGIGYRARVEDLEPAELRRLFATNVEAPLLGCKFARPYLLAGQRPHVILVASVVGRRGMPTMAAYSASKAALCSLGESLRLEWAHHRIAVSTLNPGTTATEIFAVQANPKGLKNPDLSAADAPEAVAAAILALDQKPEPERFLRWKWRYLAALSLVAPRLADKLFGSRDWMPPPPAAR
jgi:NAD(P)-dependent dehydrogenase (short-subunit alcohol dehydrogenase family)